MTRTKGAFPSATPLAHLACHFPPQVWDIATVAVPPCQGKAAHTSPERVTGHRRRPTP